jgi:hypothetical protein
VEEAENSAAKDRSSGDSSSDEKPRGKAKRKTPIQNFLEINLSNFSLIVNPPKTIRYGIFGTA